MPRAKRLKRPVSGDHFVLMTDDKLQRQAADLHSARWHVEVALTAANKGVARKRLRQTLKIVLRGLEVDHKAVKKRLERLAKHGT